jgi:hypothetical protein
VSDRTSKTKQSKAIKSRKIAKIKQNTAESKRDPILDPRITTDKQYHSATKQQAKATLQTRDQENQDYDSDKTTKIRIAPSHDRRLLQQARKQGRQDKTTAGIKPPAPLLALSVSRIKTYCLGDSVTRLLG